MKHHKHWFVGFLAVGLVAGASGRFLSVAQADTDTSGGTYEAQKATALANPYANDSGPASVDVSSYPQDIQDTYKNIFLVKCQRCHQASRPLNSQFLEPYSSVSDREARKADKEAKIAKWKASQPEIFKDKLVWQPEPAVWDRYVHKMMSKAGCNIAPAEGKKIWEFLCYDSEHRKTGANAAAWAEHRKKLLADFKAKYPDRYRELYEVQ